MKHIREHPILFSGEMVRAILDGHKTQTRRAINTQLQLCQSPDDEPKWFIANCPYGQAGDHLWVRETWGAVSKSEHAAPLEECNIEYRADLPVGCTDQPGGWPVEDAKGNEEAPHWKPSIYMPRWASRITLEITSVRVERLQNIKPDDVEDEGFFRDVLNIERFMVLWDLINTKRGYSWESNPWVWVIEFLRVV